MSFRSLTPSPTPLHTQALKIDNTKQLCKAKPLGIQMDSFLFLYILTGPDTQRFCSFLNKQRSGLITGLAFSVKHHKPWLKTLDVLTIKAPKHLKTFPEQAVNTFFGRNAQNLHKGKCQTKKKDTWTNGHSQHRVVFLFEECYFHSFIQINIEPSTVLSAGFQL